MSNRFTKYAADKLRLDGWLDKEQADHLRTQLKSVEADAAVVRGAVELVIDAYSFVSGGSREPISTAMKRPENEMNVFRLVISLNNLKNKCESTNAGKSLLLRLQEAEWLLDHCPDSLDPNPMVNKQWWSRRDTFLNPKPQQVVLPKCQFCGKEGADRKYGNSVVCAECQRFENECDEECT